MKSIKLLQYLVIVFVCFIIIFATISMFNNQILDRLIAVMGAVLPFMLPVLGASFAGNPLKKYIEGKNGNIKTDG